MVQLLLDRGADPNIIDMGSLDTSTRGSLETAEDSGTTSAGTDQ